MATPPSPDTIMLFKLLEEDPEKWHGYYDIKNKIAEKVPPGRAIRKYKQRLRESRELRGTQNVDVVRSDSEMIRLGAMACAQVALTSWKGKGIMIRGEGPYKEIRIKPGFQSWGLVRAPEGPSGAAGEEQDPVSEAEGYTELPPGDSEPSEAPSARPEEASVPAPKRPVPGFDTLPEPVEPFRRTEPAAVAVAHEPVVEDLVPDPVEAEPIGVVAKEAVEEQMPSRFVTTYEVETCPDCGMGMTDKAIHEDWHAQLRRVTATSGSAFLDPETLRTLIEDVMRQALTRFQVNMQDWMENQFAEVERQIRLGGKAEKVRNSWAEDTPY